MSVIYFHLVLRTAFPGHYLPFLLCRAHLNVLCLWQTPKTADDHGFILDSSRRTCFGLDLIYRNVKFGHLCVFTIQEF